MSCTLRWVGDYGGKMEDGVVAEYPWSLRPV